MRFVPAAAWVSLPRNMANAVVSLAHWGLSFEPNKLESRVLPPAWLSNETNMTKILILKLNSGSKTKLRRGSVL
jgi:hypothetical protein